MGITHYLAMTAAELRYAGTFPRKIAWMGCHFSPYGLGLSNFPRELPEGSLLILDDITPIRGHDPVLIGEQLNACIEGLGCCGVLLDFQRPGFPECTALAKHLSQALPCPVAVSELYCSDCPIAFLPAAPCHVPLGEYLQPWKGKEIWLEAAFSCETLTLTAEGCSISPIPALPLSAESFAEETLHCHYRIKTTESEIQFALWRTREDLNALSEEATLSGVTHTVGLYQELSE